MVPKLKRKGFDSLNILIAWSLWKQCNARVFGNEEKKRTVLWLVSQICDDIRDWIAARAVCLDIFLRE